MYYDSTENGWGIIGRMQNSGKKDKTIARDVTSLLYVRRIFVYGTVEYNKQNHVVGLNFNGNLSITMASVKTPVSDGRYLYACKDVAGEEYTPLVRENMDEDETATFDYLSCSLPFPYQSWVYINCEDGIYRTDKYGSPPTKISDDQYTAINTAGDWLIYRSKDGILKKMRPDGSDLSAFWD